MKTTAMMMLVAVMCLMLAACGGGQYGGSVDACMRDGNSYEYCTQSSSAVQTGTVKLVMDFRTNKALAKTVYGGTVAPSLVDTLKGNVSYVEVDVYTKDDVFLFTQDIPVVGGVLEERPLNLPVGDYVFWVYCNNSLDDELFYASIPLTVAAGQTTTNQVVDLEIANSLYASFSIVGIAGNFDRASNYYEVPYYEVDTVAFNAIEGDTMGAGDAYAFVDSDGTLRFDTWIQLSSPTTRLWYTVKDKNGTAYSQWLDINMIDLLQKRSQGQSIQFSYEPGSPVNITVNFPTT